MKKRTILYFSDAIGEHAISVFYTAIKKNYSRLILLFIGFFTQTIDAYGQDFNFKNYWQDSTYRVAIVKAKVKSVLEFQKFSRASFVSIRGFRFDKAGRVTASYLPGYPGDSKSTYQYDNKGKLIKEKHFEDRDTSKLSYWWDFEYKEGKNLVIGKKSYYDAHGKIYTDIAKTEILLSSKEKKVRKKTTIEGDLFKETTYFIDSTHNGYHFIVITKKTVPTKIKAVTDNSHKSITRSYLRNGKECVDVLGLSITSGVSKLTFCTTTCSTLDSNKRKTETVETNYAYTLPEYPENENQILQMIDSGKTQGEIKEIIKYSYDDNGLLLEKNTRQKGYGVTTIRYKYNIKNQLIEEIQSGTIKRKTVYTYNEYGFIENIKFYTSEDGIKEETFSGELDYKFEYYE
ncbi:MAG: hypothetical protein KF900_04840 [Bacteroidetes bacterium]|nr:hypothetical protein [Bacteroidota bacterium]